MITCKLNQYQDSNSEYKLFKIQPKIEGDTFAVINSINQEPIFYCDTLIFAALNTAAAILKYEFEEHIGTIKLVGKS